LLISACHSHFFNIAFVKMELAICRLWEKFTIDNVNNAINDLHVRPDFNLEHSVQCATFLKIFIELGYLTSRAKKMPIHTIGWYMNQICSLDTMNPSFSIPWVDISNTSILVAHKIANVPYTIVRRRGSCEQEYATQLQLILNGHWGNIKAGCFWTGKGSMKYTNYCHGTYAMMYIRMFLQYYPKHVEAKKCLINHLPYELVEYILWMAMPSYTATPLDELYAYKKSVSLGMPIVL
jgi:hypothetical protein